MIFYFSMRKSWKYAHTHINKNYFLQVKILELVIEIELGSLIAKVRSDLCWKVLLLLKVHDWIDNLTTGSVLLKKQLSEPQIVFKTDISSPDKSASIVSSSQQQKIVKPHSEDDIVAESSPGGVGVSEPATCKLSNGFFFSLFEDHKYLSLLLIYKAGKLICCKHFLQQKAFFEGSLTTSGWIIKFC